MDPMVIGTGGVIVQGCSEFTELETNDFPLPYPRSRIHLHIECVTCVHIYVFLSICDVCWLQSSSSRDGVSSAEGILPMGLPMNI
jgi:hypothetical protein